MTPQELHDQFHARPSVLNNGKAGPKDIKHCKAPACIYATSKKAKNN